MSSTLIKWIAGFCLCAVAPAHATLSDTDQEALGTLQHLAKISHSFHEFVENSKGYLPEPLFKFVQEKNKNNDYKVVPKFWLKGDTIQIDFGKDGIVPLKPISSRDLIFAVNGKTLELGQTQDLEKRWQTILDTFPKDDSNALYNLFFPRLDAQIMGPLIRRVGPLAASRVGSFLGGGTAVWLGYGILGANASCAEIGKLKDQCNQQRWTLYYYYKEMEDKRQAQVDKKAKAEADKKAKAKVKSKKGKHSSQVKNATDDSPDDEEDDDDLKAWKTFLDNRQKAGQVSCLPADKDLDKDTSQMFSDVSRGIEPLQTWIAICGIGTARKRIQKVKDCMEDVKKMSEQLCLHVSLKALAEIRGEENGAQDTTISLPTNTGTGNTPAGR